MASPDDATRYHRIQLGLGLAGLALALAYLLLVLASGFSAQLTLIVSVISDAWWVQVAVVAAVLGAGQILVGLPLRVVRGFWLPRRFGLLHQPFPAWLLDGAKAAALGGLLGLGGVLVVYGLLRVTAWWWLVAAAVFFVVGIALAALFPVLIVPLFYRLTRLSDPALEARLLALAARAGVAAIGVWVVDQSRKSRTANAAVVGLGRTRRIILFDTLATAFREEEVEAVLAHELGHHVHGDVWRGLVVQGALTLCAFWIADRAVGASAGWLGLAGKSDPAALPLWALVTTGVTLASLPVMNGWSRHVERRADDFALDLTRKPGAFVGAMERLASLNLAERRPHFLEEWLLYSHPSVGRRIDRAQAGGPRSAG